MFMISSSTSGMKPRPQLNIKGRVVAMSWPLSWSQRLSSKVSTLTTDQYSSSSLMLVVPLILLSLAFLSDLCISLECRGTHSTTSTTDSVTGYCDWDREIMGPIPYQQGLEQGGCNSSELYKVYNNDLLKIVQKSNQGVNLGNGLSYIWVGPS